MFGLSKIRSLFYTVAKLLGDVSAIRKGPDAIARRIARRIAGKATGRILGKIF